MAVALKRSYLGAYHDVERRARDGAGGAEGAKYLAEALKVRAQPSCPVCVSFVSC